MNNTNKVVNDTTKKIINDLKDLLINEGSFITREDKRQLELRLRKFVREQNLSLNPTLTSVKAVNDFVKSAFKDKDTSSSKDGLTISVEFLQEASTNFQMNLQPRSYQREKVSSIEWKQDIMCTVLINKEYRIPPIHIRILKKDDGTVMGYEIADGQQRATAILDFMSNKFRLPKNFLVGSCDCSEMNYSDIVTTYPTIAQQIRDYTLSAVFYDNFSDEKISDLFINILNNTNDLVPQEKNNATRSFFADFVRYTSRNGNGTWTEQQHMFHELFHRETVKKGTDKEKTIWSNFSPKWTLGRMEGDNWLASLIYLYLNGLYGGVNPSSLSKFYKETSQSAGHEKGWNFKTEMKTSQHGDLTVIVKELLSIALKISKAGSGSKNKLKPVFMLFAVLFGYEMKETYQSKNVDWSIYTSKLFDLWDTWCDPKVYKVDENGNDRFQANGKSDMGPFSGLWGSPNSNVFKTARMIVLPAVKENPSDWGFVELDKRESFPKSMVEQRHSENGGVCDYTGEPLSIEDAVGDHDIPRSWGISMGGVTEYHNLKITTAYHNGKKLNRNGEQYKQYLEELHGSVAV